MRLQHRAHAFRPARRATSSTSITACGLPIDTAPKVNHGRRRRRARTRPARHRKAVQRHVLPARNRGTPMAMRKRPSGRRVTACAPTGLSSTNCIAAGGAIAHQPRGDATRAVAALLRRGAIGVPDAVAGHRAALRGGSTVRIWSQPTPVWRSAERAAQFGIGRRHAVAQVDHDEVVAGAVHLGEAQRHALRGADVVAAASAIAIVAGGGTLPASVAGAVRGGARRPWLGGVGRVGGTSAGVGVRRRARSGSVAGSTGTGLGGSTSGPLLPQPASRPAASDESIQQCACVRSWPQCSPRPVRYDARRIGAAGAMSAGGSGRRHSHTATTAMIAVPVAAIQSAARSGT